MSLLCHKQQQPPGCCIEEAADNRGRERGGGRRRSRGWEAGRQSGGKPHAGAELSSVSPASASGLFPALTVWDPAAEVVSGAAFLGFQWSWSKKKVFSPCFSGFGSASHAVGRPSWCVLLGSSRLDSTSLDFMLPVASLRLWHHLSLQLSGCLRNLLFYLIVIYCVWSCVCVLLLDS